MSATLVSSNTTIKINAAVNAASALASSGTLYTAPANGYAIIHFRKASTSNNANISIAGRALHNAQTTEIQTIGSAMAYYVGPSQSVTWSSGGIESAGAFTIFGVEFVNTP